VLDAAGRAYVFASSCSPVVTAATIFPPGSSATRSWPIPRSISSSAISLDQNLTLTAKFAYADSEFLAATDERFRPSNLYNGPDGAL